MILCSDVDFLLQSLGRGRRHMKAKWHAEATAGPQKGTSNRSRTSSAASVDTVSLMRQVLELQDEYDFSIVLAQAEKLKPGIIEWVTVYLQPRTTVPSRTAV